MLPRLHGFELCARIKEESDYTAKVMILTAVYKKYKYKGKVQAEYHVDEYLDKPFQITEFLEVFHKMAEGATEYGVMEVFEEEKPVEPPADSLTILVGSGTDAKLAANVTVFCERRSMKPVITHDSRAFFDHLKTDNPDILLIRDDMPGIDPFVAGHIVRSFTVMDHKTMVLVARTRSRLDAQQTEFDHRVAAPVDKSVLERIVNLHLSAQNRKRRAPLQEEAVDENRVDSLVRSKVARVLKSHNQLEEYYSTKVRELEEELRLLKEKGDVPGAVENEEPVEIEEIEEIEEMEPLEE
jgi:DNA-binding response OmpR family regulator